MNLDSNGVYAQQLQLQSSQQDRRQANDHSLLGRILKFDTCINALLLSQVGVGTVVYWESLYTYTE
jgi:hypothetical protein